MGVPRFYRWLAKRYPAFRCGADDGVQPHVDNLYLDLNGIVHQCARHDRGPGVPAAPKEEIFAEVFAEISAIVELVRPRQLLFLGLDGVAPRAKLNQQRARRFVSAQEKPPRDDYNSAPQWFDGNCITPGTAFMHALGDALAFLVQQKMSEDSHWAPLDVVLSTTAVPGEGEHKIMEYIRRRDDPPTTVHCAYGADADLVLLALASHQPHFLVIREIPDYSSMRSVVGGAEVRPHRSCAAMEFMSISVLREYLKLDLCSPAAAGFFDIERAIDDFVLCSFLCGNDFLPHLPCVDIGEGALDAIVLLYRRMLPEWQGEYLTLDGEIAVDRFENFLQELSVLEPIVLGLKSAAGRRTLTGNVITGKVLRAVNNMWEDRIERSDDVGSLTIEQIRSDFRPKADKRPGDWVCPKCAVNNFAHRKNCFKCAASKPDVQSAEVGTDTEAHDDSVSWVDQSKREYYAQKLCIAPQGACQRRLCREFLRGMAWTLRYYVSGCESWGWFYPFHYAPFLSDMVNLSQHCVYELGFELGQPYTPLQQLLAVLPPGSAWALPGAYRELMLDPSSSIADFYPAKFLQDANGKRNDWEATILLDFVDERRLLAAANTADAQLTPLEAKRNTFALPLRFRRRGVGTQLHIKSPLPNLFPDLYSSVRCWQDRGTEAQPTYHTQLRPGATCVPPPSPSLPVLWRSESNVTGGLETPGKVYVFGETKSTKNSIVVLLEPTTTLEDNVDKYKSLCGAVISINWPWQQLAVCTGLLAENGYVGDEGLQHLHFDSEKKAMLRNYRSERGLCLPEPTIIVYAKPIRHAAEVSSGRPFYGTDDILAYPLSCVGQVDTDDWRIAETIQPPLQDGATAIVIDKSSAYFGGICDQITKSTETGKLVARIETRATASLAPVVGREIDLQGQWLTIDELCTSVHLSSIVAEQLVQDLHFRFRKQIFDVGLHFRFFKRGLLRAGFVRRKGNCMQGTLVYSPQAVEYIQAYQNHVPELFDALAGMEAMRAQPTKTRIGFGTAGQPFVAAEVFGQDVAESVLDRCTTFRTYLAGIWKEPLYHNSSAVLDSTTVKQLEECLDAEEWERVVEVAIDESQVLLPGAFTDVQHDAFCGPSSSPARATLGSRVCYTMSSGVVQFGTTGTVVGIHPPNVPDQATTSIGWTLDVICSMTSKQKCAIGGSSLGGRCSALRGISVPASHVVNIGQDSSYPETDPVGDCLADQETLGAVKEQIEFYMSDRNLRKDSYFGPLVQLQPDGFVAIPKFLACNRIKQLTSDASFIARACRGSERLVVSTDGTAIRRVSPLAPVQDVKQVGRTDNQPTICTTTCEDKHLPAFTVSERTVDAEESSAQSRAKPAVQVQQPAGHDCPKSPMQAQRIKKGQGADPYVVATCTAGALVPLTATIAATVQPHFRRHTILAFTLWPTCLMAGHAFAQSARPARKGIMKGSSPAATVHERCATQFATAAAIASGVAVSASRCAETFKQWYANPSVGAAIQAMETASAKLHVDRSATTAAETPLLVVHQAKAAVVALSLLPFGYVCGVNVLK